MPHDRFYAPDPLTEQQLFLQGKEQEHLTRVMRKRVGDTVEIVNGKGKLAKGKIVELGKRQTVIELLETTQEEKKKEHLRLIQAIPRPNRLDTIVEKATELGATEIILWPSEKSEKRNLSPTQQERLKQITISSLKQCGRLYLPPLIFLEKEPDWKNYLPHLFFGDTEEKAPLQPSPDATIVIGPEAGFTEMEIERLRKSGAKGVCLHKNILRTDTAALVGLTLLACQ